MIDSARLTAVKTLTDIEEKKSYSNLKLNYYFKKNNLSPLDRAFTSEILYGTIRWRLKIDYLIQKYLKSKIEKLDLWTLNCMRITVYQIFFMDKVPDFAAVNQAVDLVKIKAPSTASMTNAILRNILRNKAEFENINIEDKYEKLSIEYSHPVWFVKKFFELLGEDFTKALMLSNNTPPDLTLRVNTLKTTRAELIYLLEDKCTYIKEGGLDEALRVKGLSGIDEIEEFKKGYFTVQDESSMLVSKVLSPSEGDKIIDMCSAPGGKTTHMAQLMHNKGELLAFDIHEHKINLIKSNADRLGINIINTYLKDSSIYLDEFEATADKVLIDAPCSGLGLLRKKPEIRFSITENDIKALQLTQYKILCNAARYLKKGGTLVYSTCTITKEENEDMINKFVKYNREFYIEKIDIKLKDNFESAITEDGFIRLYPNTNNTDGFFIAKLKRKGE